MQKCKKSTASKTIPDQTTFVHQNLWSRNPAMHDVVLKYCDMLAQFNCPYKTCSAGKCFYLKCTSPVVPDNAWTPCSSSKITSVCRNASSLEVAEQPQSFAITSSGTSCGERDASLLVLSIPKFIMHTCSHADPTIAPRLAQNTVLTGLNDCRGSNLCARRHIIRKCLRILVCFRLVVRHFCGLELWNLRRSALVCGSSPTWNLVAQRPLKRLKPGKPSGMGARTFSRHLGLGNISSWERKLTASCTAKCSSVARLCAPAAFTFGGIAYGYY